MKFFNISVLSLAALLAPSLVSATVNWNSAAAQTCAVDNWSEIKDVVDPNILQNWDFIPAMLKLLLAQSNALNSDHTLIDNPTVAQILVIYSGFPSGIFSPYADNIVQACLDNPSQPESTTPSTSEEQEPTSSTADEQEPTSSTADEQEPTSSTADEQGETSSTADEESESSSTPAEESESNPTSADESESSSTSAEVSESSSTSAEESESSPTSAEESESGSPTEPTSTEGEQETATSSAPAATSTDSPKCRPRPAY
ncbi:hypothetical protein LPJ59_000202 [Coemansia sp. RSA 2399]|nr:hypothetical protein LPJ59_000202 [Coemansia sp. RSA 2399]KAJ1908319.1 hypothetical protein LPJ81_000179 [Coemansia sp. IMI 209127]